jgi:hypothetical protein
VIAELFIDSILAAGMGLAVDELGGAYLALHSGYRWLESPACHFARLTRSD